MIKLIPLVMAIAYGLVMLRFSVYRTQRMLDEKSTPLRDPRLCERTNCLAKTLDLPKVIVHVYEVEPINGLAAPDGRIFITRGFLNKYTSGEVTADEMVSVIAHELGHVALGHSRRRMIDFSGQNAIRVVLGTVLGRFIPVIGPYIASALTSLLAARLSRQDEYEADAYASALLTKAGIGTAPQKTLFAKLEKLSGSNGAALPVWLLSHPKTSQRIAAIEALEAKWNIASQG